MKETLKYNYIWSKQEFTDILNDNGYVHFVSKEKVSSFTEGRAFYFCKENKEYGYVDVIPYSEVEKIKENGDYLRSLANFKDKDRR